MFNIPQFVSARSPQGLLRSMLAQNMKDSTQYNYFSIVCDPDGKWVAWFYKKIEETKLLAEAVDAQPKK